MTEYSVVASHVFKLTLRKHQSFLRRKFSGELAAKTKSRIKQAVVEQLGCNPYLGRQSDRLLTIGLYDYREWLIDDHNLVLYRVDDEQKTVVLLLILDTRQSLQKLLFEVNLLV